MTEIKVFYWTKKAVDDTKLDIFFYGKINMNYIDRYYVNVFNEIISTSLEDEELLEELFEKFNSEDNPLQSEEKQRMIGENNSHTSMSVGDVIKLNDQYYSVGKSGFLKF